MATSITQLNRFAQRINATSSNRLNEKVCEWKEHYNGTKEYQRGIREVESAQ